MKFFIKWSIRWKVQNLIFSHLKWNGKENGPGVDTLKDFMLCWSKYFFTLGNIKLPENLEGNDLYQEFLL